MTKKNIVLVRAEPLLSGKVVTYTNVYGGTSELPTGEYEVEVTGEFHDYETGDILHGRLVGVEAWARLINSDAPPETNKVAFRKASILKTSEQWLIEHMVLSLERLSSMSRSLVSRRPVRDMDEALAEAQHLIAKAQQILPKKG